MKKTLPAVTLAAFLVPFAAGAQTVTDKASCTQAVADAKQGLADATVGPKAKTEVEDLIRISDHLCTQANFAYVERLLQIARGMTAGE